MKISETLQKKNNNFNLLRVLLSSSVIYYHSFSIFDQRPQQKFLMAFSDMGVGSLAVEIFFFLSGILVTRSLVQNPSILSWLSARFLRIFPAFFVVIMMTALIIGPLTTTLHWKEYIHHQETLDYISQNLILSTRYSLPGLTMFHFSGINGSIWTIRYEVFCYALFILSAGILLRINKLCFVALATFLVLAPLMGMKDLFYPTSNIHSFYMLMPCFFLGSIIALYSHLISRNTVLFLSLAFLLSYMLSENTNMQELKYYSLAFLGCFGSLYLFTDKTICKIKVNNDISYGMYLWGFPVQQLTYLFISHALVTGFLVSLILSAVAGMLSWKLIEKPALALKPSRKEKYTKMEDIP